MYPAAQGELLGPGLLLRGILGCAGVEEFGSGMGCGGLGVGGTGCFLCRQQTQESSRLHGQNLPPVSAQILYHWVVEMELSTLQPCSLPPRSIVQSLAWILGWKTAA